VPGGLWFFFRIIKGLVKADLRKIRPIDHAREHGNCAALFGHARDDNFVFISQGRSVFEAWECPDKEFVELPGNHHSRRKDKWMRKGIEFILKRSAVPFKPHKKIQRTMEIQDPAHFSSFEMMIRGMRDMPQDEMRADLNP